MKDKLILLASLLGWLLVAIPFVPMRTAAQQTPQKPLPITGGTTVQAGRQSYPWLNLSEGRELHVAYPSEIALGQALASNQAEPMALASGDFDEDGVPDLVAGYASAGSGIVSLIRGNPASFVPGNLRRESGNFASQPFLPAARLFEVPERTDFVGSGDFNGDGHSDVVTAAIGSSALYLLAGDGRGGLGAAQRIELPGRVTAAVTGEINRRDGLTDVIVGIKGPDGPRVLVFEGPDGALRAAPEMLSLPAEATALALGQLDGDAAMDLAVAAGRTLVIVHGRDRKSSLDPTRQAEVAPAILSERSFPFTITSVAVGNFTEDGSASLAVLSEDGTVQVFAAMATESRGSAESTRSQIADWRVRELFRSSASSPSRPGAPQLIPARLSALPGDDLVVLNRLTHRLHVVATHSSTRFPVRDSDATLDLADEPAAVLPIRLDLNARQGLMILRKGLTAPLVLQTLSGPTFTVTNTSDSGAGSLRQAIGDANTNGGGTIAFNIPGSGVHTITTSGLPTMMAPMLIDGYSQPGSSANTLANGDNAVLTIEIASVAPGSGTGLTISTGSTIQGLAINRFTNGILIPQVGGIAGNVVQGNFIGSSPAGTACISIVGNASGTCGNAGAGVLISGSDGNTIGGTVPAARNVISINGLAGVEIDGSFTDNATGNNVLGNFIGTTASGTSGLGNGSYGVFLRAANATVGAAVAGARNVISANGLGIQTNGPFFVAGNLIQGNFIGTDVNGAAALGNGGDGVELFAPGAGTIGGTTPAARNIISGNGGAGVNVGSPGSLVQGNFIGTNAAGAAVLANGGDGVSLAGSSNAGIGGIAAGAANVISGNRGHGVSFNGPAASNINNTVQGNLIGAQADGVSPLGNGGHGLYSNVGTNNTIGGPASGAGNIVAFNGGDGVRLNRAFTNTSGLGILGNSIFSNGRLGISFADANNSPLVTPNDHCDPDGGPNNLQNYPILTSAASGGGNTIVQGTLDSAANTSFRVELFPNAACSPSGFGEGRTSLGSTLVMTDGACNANLSVTLPVGVPVGQFVTATATDPGNNTSEFSRCSAVTALPTADISITKTGSPNPVAPGANITYSITITNSGPNAATGAGFFDLVPAGTTLQSMAPPAGWTCTPALDGSYFSCTSPSMAAGGTAVFSIVVRVVPSVTVGTIISNTATVSSSSIDPNPANNSATATTTVQAPLTNLAIGPIYTQGASYRIALPSAVLALGPIYTQGASYRIALPTPLLPIGPIYTQGASYRIALPATVLGLGPIYTQGASYLIGNTTFHLTTAVSPSGAGTISPATGNHALGESVQVTAFANPGYVFSGFSGALTGNTNPQTLVLSANSLVTANFAPVQPRLTAAVGLRTDGANPGTRNVPVTLTNTGVAVAGNATITSISSIAVVTGSGTVSVIAGTPANLGAIGIGGSATANIILNWPSTATRVSFTVNFSADGGYTGSTVITSFR